MLSMLLWCVFLSSLSTSLLSAPLQLACFASPTHFLLSLTISFVFYLLCFCFSPSVLAHRGCRGCRGWTCVFLIGLLIKKLAVSCVLWGWEWVMISEAVWEQRLLLLASLRMCEQRQGGNSAHQLHTVLIFWEQPQPREEEEAWLMSDNLKLSCCLVVISAQGWTRMVGSQRPMCLLSVSPSSPKPDLSVWAGQKRIYWIPLRGR